MDTAARFREATYEMSFGDTYHFDPAHYGDWLKQRVEQFPEGHVHVWVGEEIVGQVEVRPHHSGGGKSKWPPLQEGEGYVNFYYLEPKWRGRGIAAALDAYAVAYLKTHDCTCARLTVSKTNDRAIRFYKGLDWKEDGTRSRSEQPHCWWMTKDFGT